MSAQTAAIHKMKGSAGHELDQAPPFSLSFDAPVTAQFVVEDHALRHSWHRLARICKVLGR